MYHPKTSHAKLVARRRMYFKMKKELEKMESLQNNESSPSKWRKTVTLTSCESSSFLEEPSQSEPIHQSSFQNQELEASINFRPQSDSPPLERSELVTVEQNAPDILSNQASNEDVDERLRKNLRQLFAKYSVERTFGNELLQVLRQAGHQLPRTVDAILDTKGTEGEISTMGNESTK